MKPEQLLFRAEQNAAHARACPRKRTAFTLIELLSIIAIIGILAALLLPGMAKTKAQAQSVSCLNNLKHLQAAWLMYVHDNREALPPNNSEKHGFIQAGVSNAWGNSWVWGNAQWDANTANIEQGVLYHEVGSAAVYCCPADRSTVRGRADLRRFRSYSADGWLNSHLQSGTIEQGHNTSPLTLRSWQQLISQPPSRIFVFIDEHPQSIGDGVFGLPTSGASRELNANWWGASMPADRHRQGCNLSFADGHVKYFHWRSPKRGMAEGDVQGPANPGDLEDLKDLQECAPKTL